MTIREVFKSTPNGERFIIGDAYFVLLRWENPNGTSSGNCAGPFFVTCYKDSAIFVDADGVFKECVDAGADGYFPYLNKGPLSKKTQLKGLLKQLLEKVA
jgi:hypothetical protein